MKPIQTVGLFVESRGAKGLLYDPLLTDATLAVNDVLGTHLFFYFVIKSLKTLKFACGIDFFLISPQYI